MQRPTLAMLAALAVLTVPTAADAAEGDPRATCTPLKVIYAEKEWRDAKPLDGRKACRVKSWRGARNTIDHFRLYRDYRQVAPVRCHGGSEGYYAIPCYGSRASPAIRGGPTTRPVRRVYQIMPEWGRPFPIRSFEDRVAHHEIASGLTLSNWVCA